MTTEEQLLRSALTDAATGQPPAPYDRVDRVRRRHARRQQGRLVALGTAAVLAITGAALGFAGLRIDGGNTNPAAHRSVPSWALQWPDQRDRYIPQHVLDGAVQAWAHTHYTDTSTNDPTDPSFTTWYLGQHVANDEIAVAFEYSGGGVPYFVMGHANADQVMNGQEPYSADGTTSWGLYGVPVTDLGPRPVFGLNLAISKSEGAPDEDIVVLTDPRARRLDFQAIGADGRLSQWTAPMTRGFTEVAMEPIRSRVRINAVRDAHGKVLAGGMYVTVPTTDSVSPAPDTPVLMRVPQLVGVQTTPTGFGEYSGQGGTQNLMQSDSPWPMHATTIYARCYGGRSMVISIDSNRRGHRVVIPCDDNEHVVDGPPVMAHSELAATEVDDAHGNVLSTTASPNAHGMEIAASDYTAWRVEIYAR
jgi:hypothetical protein